MRGSGTETERGILSRLAGPPQRRPVLAVYLVAWLAVATAFGASIVTSGAQRAALFPFFTLAILVTTLYGGKRPGWLSFALSLLGIIYLLSPLAHRVSPSGFEAVRLVAFVLVGISVVVLVDRLRSTAENLDTQREWLDVTLRSIGDAVITSDAQGHVAFLNPAGEALTGWTTEEALGHPIQEVFRIINEQDGEPAADIVGVVLRERRTVTLANHTALVTKTGSRVPIEDSAAPIRDARGKLVGAVVVFHDVTERRRAQDALQRSERGVRLKLESILSPEGDIGTLELRDIIDVSALQALMDQFYQVAHIPMALLDMKGNVLVGVGWQDICTKFHRVNPESCKHCLESDLELSAGVAPGDFKIYKCKNNMWDVVTPLMVGGEHVGNIFSGQFFFEGESPDREVFRTQARLHAFDETKYLAALDRVPRLSREALTASMTFVTRLADMISKLSYSNIKLARSLAERDVLTDSLRSNEARLRLALDAANSGNWEWDLQTNTYTWSNEVWGLYGLEPHSCEPSYETWLATVYPPDRELAQKVVAEAVRTGTELNLEYRVLDAGGKTRWLMARGRPVCDANGYPVRFVGIVMDINERKRSEAALLQSDKLASVGRMATTIAHEINNPLAAVTNTVYIARHRVETPHSVRQDLEVADAELRRIAHITRQALGFYRESSSPEPVSVKSIVESTVDLLASRIKAKCATVEKHCEDDCRVTAVGGELRQVLANLLANSLDAIGQHGTVKLRASTLRALNAHSCVRITVADNGKGIEPGVLPHIFEPFFTTKDSVGTGLGLWVTRQIIDKHRGSIRVRSTTAGPHRGTVFSIFLPAEPAALGARAKAAAL
jgi:PAS domain S-box-containing protein